MSASEYLSSGVLVLDYGSPQTLPLAKRLRALGIYTEIWAHLDKRLAAALDQGRAPAKGIIVSGGSSFSELDAAVSLDPRVLALGVPVLGICSGAQLLAEAAGAQVASSAVDAAESGTITVEAASALLGGVAAGASFDAPLRSADSLSFQSGSFSVLARDAKGAVAAFSDEDSKLYGLQFYPERLDSELGDSILRGFAVKIAGCSGDWSMAAFLEASVIALRDQIGDSKVICGLSGGVDSSVVAALLARACPNQVVCVLVDNGLLRHQEADLVEEAFRGHFDVEFKVIDAKERYLTALRGVTDPEVKRKIIGELFIRVFEEVGKEFGGAKYLAQGTLYADVVESVSADGKSVAVKSHHNVGGLPERMGLELVEPLRELFKDEVRELGRELGLPELLVSRHPFPGPGLAVRILGEVTSERLEAVRAADHIFMSGLRDDGLYDQVWQAFAVLVPVKTVGVWKGARTYDWLCALRAVTSTDGMSAERVPLPHEFLGRMSDEIIASVPKINRVVYDISSKPPATIEWE